MDFFQENKRHDPEELFQKLVRDYYLSIERYFQSWLSSAAESEDLTQETFLNAFRGLPYFRGDAQPRTWLVEIAKHVLHNTLRHRIALRRKGQEYSLDDPESGIGAEAEVLRQAEAEDILTQLLDRERGELLIREIDKLPSQMGNCLRLRAQGLEYHEIATTMGISIQTVRSQLYEGKKRLKAKLEVELNDG